MRRFVVALQEIVAEVARAAHDPEANSEIDSELRPSVLYRYQGRE